MVDDVDESGARHGWWGQVAGGFNFGGKYGGTYGGMRPPPGFAPAAIPGLAGSGPPRSAPDWL